jgi:DNA-directed RNA polymerase specialized sigma24 family protein
MRMRGVDTELVKRAQHGDREAFGLVAADLATKFLAVSRRILRDLDLAEDATQQALVAIWRDLPLRRPALCDEHREDLRLARRRRHRPLHLV